MTSPPQTWHGLSSPPRATHALERATTSDCDAARMTTPPRQIEPSKSLAPLGLERNRRFERTRCRIPVIGTIRRQMKAGPAAVGDQVNFIAEDISQGGALLACPWPLSQNDLYSLSFTRPDGTTFTKPARVIRVRRGDDDRWLAGVCFLTEEEAKRIQHRPIETDFFRPQQPRQSPPPSQQKKAA